ncbi:alpha/beta hydrolase family protein [Brevibacillus sp. AG162]|uniref:alpha/beta fold hydrolase n=1 Tax=Brevibacillus sp. AG162 TaxID=2572910 RepID=UPI0011519FC5|nr:alpha/beta fold hydrolase [Brevibacillus sp. AG162]TQK62437.1 alpha/beta hydrolase family protein [Brevibacillus sp. AG162]
MKSLTVYQQETRLHVLEGERNGETILFLHPQGGTSSIWNDMLPYFSEDFHIICMDLRGHGQSEHAATGYDIGTQCEDIRAVLDHTGVERAHLIGNSLGGDRAKARCEALSHPKGYEASAKQNGSHSKFQALDADRCAASNKHGNIGVSKRLGA